MNDIPDSDRCRRITVIAGGIGSGKSTVARVVRAMGYEVYDCDSRAKNLMDSSSEIHSALAAEISPDVVTDGMINRSRLSELVFSDSVLLETLNRIVHTHVKEDIRRWMSQRARFARNGRLFIETALLYESGLDRMADDVWLVDAPDEIRVDRVMKRNAMTRNQVENRIAAQRRTCPEKPHSRISIIANDGFHPILPRISRLLEE